MLGITVQELAAVLGLPYQQLHKYETGANRLSAGRLYRLAEALGVEVAYFFEGGEGEAAAPTAQRRMLLELVRNFARIHDRRQQEALARLARTLAGLGAGGLPAGGGGHAGRGAAGQRASRRPAGVFLPLRRMSNITRRVGERKSFSGRAPFPR